MTRTIFTATAAEVVPAAALIAPTFSDLHVAAWLVPDPVERAAVLAAHVGIVVEYATAYGQVDLIRDRDGLSAEAVWIDDTRPVPEHHHELLNRNAIGGYLEASSPPSRHLYLRRGWYLLPGPFAVAGGAWLWPMWRPPSAIRSGMPPGPCPRHSCPRVGPVPRTRDRPHHPSQRTHL